MTLRLVKDDARAEALLIRLMEVVTAARKMIKDIDGYAMGYVAINDLIGSEDNLRAALDQLP